MPVDILQSVLALTDQRNIESLEHNLPASIAALLPIHSISIYKPIEENSNYDEVKEILKFLVLKSEPQYLWSAEPLVLNANTSLKTCFKKAEIREIPKTEGTSEIYYPITIDGKTMATLRVESETLDDSQRQVLDGLTKIYKNYLTILHESERDTLTALLNRRTFDQRFDKLIAVQKHQQRALWEEFERPEKRHLENSDKIFLAMIDIDHFKQVNDNYGHIYGDEILILVAKIMKKAFRSSDLLFRFGGEEFVILLEPTTQGSAYQALDRFREMIADYQFPQVGTLTVSIGYTAVIEKNYASTACEKADEALYYAKNKGRNCIYCYEELCDNGQIDKEVKSGSVEIF